MDTLGALALGTEPPTQELLHRKPYKRNASLLSWPMRRNIICQSAYQLTLLLVLLFKGAQWFNVEPIGQINCLKYSNIDRNMGNNGPKWNILTSQQTSNSYYTDVSCDTFKDLCPGLDRACFKEQHTIFAKNTTLPTQFSFLNLDQFEDTCVECVVKDYTHGTIIFNAFIFCQVN